MGEIRRTIGVMQFVVVAHRCTDTNEALAFAAETWVPPPPCCPRATRCESSSRETSPWDALLRVARDRRGLELVGA